MFNIPVVLGSVRQGRKSERVAKYFLGKLQTAGVTSQLVDFIELPLPFVNCEKEPAEYEKQYPDANVQKWSNIADAADGFIFVVPEYNHGYSGVLKNALDWLYAEFKFKPAGLVGVSSGRIGAARAVENLRPIMGNFNMFDIREAVLFGPVRDALDEEGNLVDTKYEKQVNGLMKNLLAAAEAMKKMRQEIAGSK